MIIGTLISAAAATQASAGELIWEAQGRLRLLRQSAHAAAFKPEVGQSAHDFVMTLMPAPVNGAYTPYRDSVLVESEESDREFPADHFFPKVHPVVARLTTVPAGKCRWQYGQQSAEAPCDSPIRFSAVSEFGEGDAILTIQLPDGTNVAEEIRVRDKLILGLGDSYASGESNPDAPTKIDFNGLRQIASNRNGRAATGRWMKNTAQWVNSPAEWLDRRCHRSMFSHQIIVAASLAAANPHQTVSILPLACSGAEVFDGLVVPQKSPPGGGGKVESQVSAAIRELCDGAISIKKMAQTHPGTGKKFNTKEIVCGGRIRSPDMILLSVGGNDVGFVPLIAWATAPPGWRSFSGFVSVRLSNDVFIKPVCPSPNPDDGRCRKNAPPVAERILSWLPNLYRALDDRLRMTGLRSEQTLVALTAYPDPTRDENGDVCSYCSTEDGNEQARTRIPTMFHGSAWNLGFTSNPQDGETALIVGRVIEPLQKQMRSVSGKLGWVFVDSHLTAFKKHGICAGYGKAISECPANQGSTRDPGDIPAFPHVVNQQWFVGERDGAACTGLTCPDWKAYVAARTRYFRNTNDSTLFQTDCVKSRGVDCKNGGFSGAYHPDARGHGLVADAILDALGSSR